MQDCCSGGLMASGKIRAERAFAFRRDGDKVRIDAGSGCCGRYAIVDELMVAGFRPDFDFLREVRLMLDPAECPPELDEPRV